MVQPDRQGLCERTWQRPSRIAAPTRGRPGWTMRRVKMFEDHLEANLEDSRGVCGRGHYRPQRGPPDWIPKAGQQGKAAAGDPDGPRPGGANGIAEGAGTDLRARRSRSTATAFAPAGDAKTRCDEWIELLEEGYIYIVDADLKSYFDTIPHDRLLAVVGQKISDGRVLA